MNDIKKLREMTGAGLADCKRRVRLLPLSVATARLLRVACS